MPKPLVIVESPAKARTIAGFLGDDYHVESSVGHIRDLPSKGLSIDVDDHFTPTYEVHASKKDPSREHSNVRPDSSEVNAKLASRLAEREAGPDVMVVSGAVRSRQNRSATASGGRVNCDGQTRGSPGDGARRDVRRGRE